MKPQNCAKAFGVSESSISDLLMALEIKGFFFQNTL